MPGVSQGGGGAGVLHAEGGSRVEDCLCHGGAHGFLEHLLGLLGDLAFWQAVGEQLGEVLVGQEGDCLVALLIVDRAEVVRSRDVSCVELHGVIGHGVDFGEVVLVRQEPGVCPVLGLGDEVAAVDCGFGGLDGGDLGGRVSLLEEGRLRGVELGVLGLGGLVQELQVLGLNGWVVRSPPAGCIWGGCVERALGRRRGLREGDGWEETSYGAADAHCVSKPPGGG